MENELIYAVALLLEQADTIFHLVAEPVKMTMEQCVEMAKTINEDTTIPYIMTCTPFVEPVITQ